MPNITLLLLTHNSVGDIKTNLSWLSRCSRINEIVNIDDYSTDKTLPTLQSAIPKQIKLVSKKRHLDNNFASQRQYAIKFATNNYILWLDPDEQPTDKFVDFLNHVNLDTPTNYSFPRTEIFLGHQLRWGETRHIRHLRLFDHRHGQFTGQVHETWQSNPTRQLSVQNYPIIHRPQQKFYDFIRKIDFYSTIRSQELYSHKVPPSLFQNIFYPLGKFVLNYFFRLGFLDSTPGIIFAICLSFHSFLVRAKLWHLYQSSST